jgi:cytoskeletal protein CcmA (bactofilin family)
MAIEHGKIEGDIWIDHELILHGMIAGHTTVLQGGKFHLHGTCTGNLTIMEGGTAYIHGTVSGDVYNHRGKLEVWGVIAGHLRDDNQDAIIHRDATINGTRQS